jgi:hypothetical protein
MSQLSFKFPSFLGFFTGILRHCYDVIVEAFPASTRFKLCFFEKSFGSFFLFPNEVREEEKTP